MAELSILVTLVVEWRVSVQQKVAFHPPVFVPIINLCIQKKTKERKMKNLKKVFTLGWRERDGVLKKAKCDKVQFSFPGHQIMMFCHASQRIPQMHQVPWPSYNCMYN